MTSAFNAYAALALAIVFEVTAFAYAIWGGVGIILTATVSFVLFRQMLDAAAFVGIGLIVSGVVVINLFSQTTAH